MKVTLFMSMSVNGFIARENLSEDFLSDDNWKIFTKIIRKKGCLIWGRKTHELVMTWGKKYTKSLKGVTVIVVSSKTKKLETNWVASSPKQAIEIAKNLGFKEAILSGGSQLNSSFLKANLVNQLLLNIESVVIGQGISLFSPCFFDQRLKLKEVKKVNSKIIQLNYFVA